MRISDSAGTTDAGRKRRRNEDAFVIDPPLFAVADGMGGAQAGEVASRLAAAAFRDFHEADEFEPQERIAAIIQEANRRIYERARSDAQVSGMGTTITAALHTDTNVAIGHVGDSRAYRLREGALEQLTEDHSLVADLVRSGRLSPEEADTHPQRSVITRALGTDPEVDVDAFTVAAESGDVFVLCSDGLTTMVGDEEIVATIGGSATLEQATRALVRAANRAGGEDNITVVLFSLAAEPEPLEDTAVALADTHTESDLEDTLSGLETPAVRAASPAAVLEREETTEVWGPPEGETERPPARRRRRSWGRRLIWALVGLTFSVAVIAAAVWAITRANFIGADEDGHVVVYQGFPWELGGGIDLYRPRYVSQLRAVQLTEAERRELFDHSLLSEDDARARLERYEAEGVP
jgi:PPM family protein phosphatase